jgi:hypothetical protein
MDTKLLIRKEVATLLEIASTDVAIEVRTRKARRKAAGVEVTITFTNPRAGQTAAVLVEKVKSHDLRYLAGFEIEGTELQAVGASTAAAGSAAADAATAVIGVIAGAATTATDDEASTTPATGAIKVPGAIGLTAVGGSTAVATTASSATQVDSKILNPPRQSLSPAPGPSGSLLNVTGAPSLLPSKVPSSLPSDAPSHGPSEFPTLAPSSPTEYTSLRPSFSPTLKPSRMPKTREPLFLMPAPSDYPTLSPTTAEECGVVGCSTAVPSTPTPSTPRYAMRLGLRRVELPLHACCAMLFWERLASGRAVSREWSVPAKVLAMRVLVD